MYFPTYHKFIYSVGMYVRPPSLLGFISKRTFSNMFFFLILLDKLFGVSFLWCHTVTMVSGWITIPDSSSSNDNNT